MPGVSPLPVIVRMVKRPGRPPVPAPGPPAVRARRPRAGRGPPSRRNPPAGGGRSPRRELRAEARPPGRVTAHRLRRHHAAAHPLPAAGLGGSDVEEHEVARVPAHPGECGHEAPERRPRRALVDDEDPRSEQRHGGGQVMLEVDQGPIQPVGEVTSGHTAPPRPDAVRVERPQPGTSEPRDERALPGGGDPADHRHGTGRESELAPRRVGRRRRRRRGGGLGHGSSGRVSSRDGAARRAAARRAGLGCARWGRGGCSRWGTPDGPGVSSVTP